jgi:hypothetical protein
MSKTGRIAKKNETKLKIYLEKNGFNTQSGTGKDKANSAGAQNGSQLRAKGCNS